MQMATIRRDIIQCFLLLTSIFVLPDSIAQLSSRFIMRNPSSEFTLDIRFSNFCTLSQSQGGFLSQSSQANLFSDRSRYVRFVIPFRSFVIPRRDRPVFTISNFSIEPIAGKSCSLFFA